MTLLVAVVSGCSSVPQNSSLNAAHDSYNSARSNPEVTNLAPLELKDAGDTLNKADAAFSKDDGDNTVNQLAYIATQQVSIALETAKRKTAELMVTNAGAKRNEVRLEARTAEADAAQQQLKELQELNAKKTDRGVVITLGDVLFDTNKSKLASGGVRNMQKLADFLLQHPQQNVLVEGYTDSVGSDNFNQVLSERRAYSVRTALLDAGININRVTMRGYGESYPVAGNDTGSGRQLNRRVEIILSDNNGNITPR